MLGIATAAACSLVLLGQLGRWSLVLDQINALLSVLLVCLGVALAVSVGLRDRVVTAAALLGLAIGGIQLGSQAIAGRAMSTVTPTVRVLTLSTFHANPHPESLRTAIMAEKADVVLLQEADGNTRDVVRTLLPHYHRLRPCLQQPCHLVMLSRWPVREVTVRFTGRGPHPAVMMGEVAAPFGRFRVMNVHLPRPYKPDAEHAMNLVAVAANARARRPMLVAGDFNSATGSVDLGRFADRTRLHRHDGFIPTYPANRAVPAFAGIDHIFADRRWAGTGCHRVDAVHSDHHGVTCDLQLLTKQRRVAFAAGAPVR